MKIVKDLGIRLKWLVDKNGLTEAEKATQNLTKNATHASSQFERTSVAVNRYGRSFLYANQNVSRHALELQNAERQLNYLGSSSSNYFTKSNQGFRTSKGHVSELGHEFRRLDNTISNSAQGLNKKIDSMVKAPLIGVKSIIGGILGMVGGASLGAALNKGMTRLADIEDTTLSMNVMMGDEKRVKKYMDNMLTFAKTTPYKFQQIAGQGRNLFAYGLEEEKIIPTVKAMGDLAAASGRGSEAMDVLGRAFGKMVTNGKVGMEEINSISDAGVPAIKILANQMNLSVDDVREKVSSGAIEGKKAVDMLVDGIENGTDGIAGQTRALGGVMEELKKTWRGSLDTLGSSIQSSFATMLEPIKPDIQARMKDSEQFFKALPVLAEKARPKVYALGRILNDNVFKPVWNIGKTMGADFIKGGIDGFKALGTVLGAAVVPPLKWLEKKVKNSPEQSKKIARYAGVAIAGFWGFGKVKALIEKVTGSVRSLRRNVKGIGNDAVESATKAEVGFSGIGASVGSSGIGTPVDINAHREMVSKGHMAHLKEKASASMADYEYKQKYSKLQQFGHKFTGRPSRHANEKILLNGEMVAQKDAKRYLKKQEARQRSSEFSKGNVKVAGAAATTNMLFSNEENMAKRTGESLGMFGGMAAGGKIGAAVGTVFGPVGTAIGGAIGSAAGNWLGSNFGNVLGGKVQEAWNKVSPRVSNWIATTDFKPVKIGRKIAKDVTDGVEKAKPKIKEAFSFMGDLASEALTGKGKGKKIDIAKPGQKLKSAKKVNTYLEEVNKLNASQLTEEATGEGGTETFNKRKKVYEKQESNVNKNVNKRSNKSIKNLEKLQKLGALNSDEVAEKTDVINRKRDHEIKAFAEQKDKVLKLEQEKYAKLQELNDKENKSIEQTKQNFRDFEVQKQQEMEEKISEINAKAANENRDLTSEEIREIQNIRESYTNDRKTRQQNEEQSINEIKEEYANQRKEIAQNENTKLKELQDELTRRGARSLSKSAKEQTIILGNLNASTEELTERQAQTIIKNSYKAKKGSIKEANEKFDETKRILDEERYVTGTLSQEEYEEAVRNAESQRDDTISAANERHEQIVAIAERQADGSIGAINRETGESLTTYQNFLVEYGEKVNGFIDATNKVLSFIGIKTIPKFDIPNAARVGTVSKGQLIGSGNAMMMNYSGRNGGYAGQSLVGEEGPELAYSKSEGKARILGANGPEVAYLKQNESVLTANETKRVLNGGLGKDTILPGFAKGKGGGIGGFVDTVKDKAEDAMDWTSEQMDKIFDFMEHPIKNTSNLLKKFNVFKKGPTQEGMGASAFDLIGKGTGELLNKHKDDFSMGGGPTDASIAGNGVYQYLVNIANKIASKFGLQITSGYRPGSLNELGQPDDHSKRLAIDLSGGSFSTYDKASKYALRFKNDLKYIIANNTWAKADSGWKFTHYPYGGHLDHIHLSGKEPGKNAKIFSGSGLGNVGGFGVERWLTYVKRALKMNGLPTNAAYVNAWMKQIQTESGGNEKAMGGNDGIIAEGNAMGLLQTKPGTFNAYKFPGFGNIWNGFHNMLAAMNYAKSRYGASTMLQVIGHGHGYKNGGRPPKDKEILVGEEGPELVEFDRGATVHNTRKTQNILNNRKAQNDKVEINPVVNITVNGNADDSTVKDIKKAVESGLDQAFRQIFDNYNLGGVY